MADLGGCPWLFRWFGVKIAPQICFHPIGGGALEHWQIISWIWTILTFATPYIHNIHACANDHTHTYTICKRKHLYIHIDTYTYTCINICNNTYLHTYHTIPYHTIPYHTIPFHYITLHYIHKCNTYIHTYIHKNKT